MVVNNPLRQTDGRGDRWVDVRDVPDPPARRRVRYEYSLVALSDILSYFELLSQRTFLPRTHT